MTIPGVGQLTALAFVAAIDGPDRFRTSRVREQHQGRAPGRNVVQKYPDPQSRDVSERWTSAPPQYRPIAVTPEVRICLWLPKTPSSRR
jgi:hypothetical protein